MDVGCLVVRGHDWQWSDQDGGEGCVGTVVQVDDTSPAMVWVQWDKGARANYRAGLDGKSDLRVLESSSAGIQHQFVECDGCNQNPLLGMRWKCVDCPDYDLCTKCYMADTHEADHEFWRIDLSRGERVPVGKREGATKVQARGIFSGARVVRGHDWRWGDQDGGLGREGTVLDMRDWKIKGAKGGVAVKWDCSGRENVYRRGFEGKVDLSCQTPETGGFYYEDHLPALEVKVKKTRNGFATGDKVFINVTTEKLQELAVGHGDWNNDMEKFMQAVGEVCDFTSTGDVIVDFGTVQWRFNPQAIAKIHKFKKGDKVLVNSDHKMVEKLQEGHGGWNNRMKTMLGMIGTVKAVHDDNDVVLSVGDDMWLVNPAVLTLHEAAGNDSQEGQEDQEDDPLQSLFGQHDLGAKLLADALMGMLGKKTDKSSGDDATRLIQSASHGRPSQVKQILESDPEMVNKYSNGKTALHVSCHDGHCDIVQLLLERGADTSLLDEQDYSPMHHAAYGDKSGESILLLVKHGVDVNIQNNPKKCTPLHLAVRQGNEMGVKCLVQSNCDVNVKDADDDTPLHDAIMKCFHGIVDVILDAASINLTLHNEQGFNVLHFAAYKGNKHAAEKLLQKSPELLNVPKEDGFTALHLAAVNDHCEVAKVLLSQQGCKVDARTTKHEQTPLLLAVHEGYLDMMRILLENGADLNAEDEDGDTALHLALTRETFYSSEMAKLTTSLLFGLLADNKTSASFVSISRYLLSRGADIHHKNRKDQTPLDICNGSQVEASMRELCRENETKKSTVTTFVNNVNEFSAESTESTDSKIEESKEVDYKNGPEACVEHGAATCPTSDTENTDEEPNKELHADVVGDIKSTEISCTRGPEATQEKEEQTNEESETIHQTESESTMSETEAAGEESKVPPSENPELKYDLPDSEEEQNDTVTQEHEADGPEETTVEQQNELQNPQREEDPGETDVSQLQRTHREFINVFSFTKKPNTKESEVESMEMSSGLEKTGEILQSKASEPGETEFMNTKQSIFKSQQEFTNDFSSISEKDNDEETEENMEEQEITRVDSEDSLEKSKEEFVNTYEENVSSKTTQDVAMSTGSKLDGTPETSEDLKVKECESNPLTSEDEDKTEFLNSSLEHQLQNQIKTAMEYEIGKFKAKNGQEVKGDIGDKEKKEDEAALERQGSCLTCVDAGLEVLFKPCGHKIMCRECAVRVKRCPECKTMVDAKVTKEGESMAEMSGKENLTEKLKAMERKLLKMEDMITCCVCLERKKNIIFSCGHGACQVCAEKISTCAICKKNIQRKIAMF